MSIPETAMIDRCADCAFRAGTSAAQSWFTQQLSRLCVYVGEPFECHHIGEGHICRGWLDAYLAKEKNGDYDRLPAWKNSLARKLLDVMGDAAEADKRGEKFDGEAAIAAAMKELDMEEWGGK